MKFITNLFSKDKTLSLPVGLTEFNAFAEEVFAMSGRFADEDSMRFALASMIIHGKEDLGDVKTSYFAKRLRKVAANQVASQVFQDIKAKQIEAQEAQKAAELAAAQPEVTASEETPPSEPSES